MTNKKLILIAGVVVLCILICLLGVMCSSGGAAADEPTGTTGTERLTYTVTLMDEAGSPVPEVGVYIYEDFKQEELVWFARTDDNGQMSFTDIASDNYVAVLDGVPAGYLVEDYYPLTGETTEIVLAAGLMEGDLNSITYELGDMMLDFTVTGPDGTEYTLSELLEKYNAVVLNFWYLQCEPCKSEFPYLQEAYEKYSDKVALLAMNPVNEDNEEIAQFQKDNGYTFPMMACDPAWEKAMQLTAYPTTVVIDRYGKICLIHKGSVTDAETFETIFDFYADEEYQQTICQSIEELEEAAGVEQTVGTEDNPVEMGLTESFQVTVEPGQLMYYNIYRMTGTRYLSIRNENAYVIYGGKTYYPNNGTVSLAVSSDDVSTACQVVFGNSGDETQTYTVTMGVAAGTMGNPYTLSLGEFTTNVAAGNNSGVWYTYTPKETGLFTIELLSVTSGVDYGISVNTYTANGVGTVQRTIQSEGTTNAAGNRTVSVNAYAGKAIQVTVSTLPDSSNAYPAATFKLKASLAEGESLETTYVEPITYSVNVTDEKGNGVSGVKMIVTDADGNSIPLTTDEKGVATTKQVPTDTDDEGNEVVITYPVMITVPTGYKAKTTELTLNQDRPSASIKLDTIAKTAYTITVVDQNNKALSGAEVYFTDPATQTIVASATTTSGGKVSVTIAQGDYTVSIAKEGYATESVAVSADATAATVTLMVGDENDYQTYTVTVKDYENNPVSGVTVTFMQGNTIGGNATTNSSGVATRKLLKGTYTASVSGYYIYTNTTLTQASPSGTIVVIPPVKGTTGNLSGEKVYYVYEGMTYLDGLTGRTSSTGATTFDYFLFQPTESSVYKFTVFGSNAKISFHGTNTQMPNDLTADLGTVTDPTDEDYTGKYYDSANNCFAYDAGIEENKPLFIIGVTGDTDCVLVIEEIGTSMELPTKLVTYKNTHTPSKNYTVPSGTKKTFDLSQSIIMTQKDGYYYFNGKQVFIELAATDGRISFKDMLITYGTGFYDKYVVDGSLAGYEYLDQYYYKEAYEEAMIAYINAAVENNSSSAYYPLTEDLVYMVQMGGAYKGWYDPARTGDYLFEDQTVYGDNHWMFLLCYFA